MIKKRRVFAFIQRENLHVSCNSLKKKRSQRFKIKSLQLRNKNKSQVIFMVKKTKETFKNFINGMFQCERKRFHNTNSRAALLIAHFFFVASLSLLHSLCCFASERMSCRE